MLKLLRFVGGNMTGSGNNIFLDASVSIFMLLSVLIDTSFTVYCFSLSIGKSNWGYDVLPVLRFYCFSASGILGSLESIHFFIDDCDINKINNTSQGIRSVLAELVRTEIIGFFNDYLHIWSIAKIDILHKLFKFRTVVSQKFRDFIICIGESAVLLVLRHVILHSHGQTLEDTA